MTHRSWPEKPGDATSCVDLGHDEELRIFVCENEEEPSSNWSLWIVPESIARGDILGGA